MIQNNTQQGPIPFTRIDTSIVAGPPQPWMSEAPPPGYSYRNRLAVITREYASPHRVGLGLVGNVGVLPQFVIVDGAPGDDLFMAAPLHPASNFRVLLSGPVQAGGELVSVSATGWDNLGTAEGKPGFPGNRAIIGFAEEDGVAGQAVLFRPMHQKLEFAD